MRGFTYSVMESSEDGNRNHSGPENLKKSRPKNSWNEITQLHEKRVFSESMENIYKSLWN